MKLDDFSSRIRSHGELRGLGVAFGAVEADDRILLTRSSVGGAMAVPVRAIVDAEWSVLERLLLSGPSATGPVVSATSDAIATSVTWSRSHFGLLQDRLVRSYSVETLIGR